MNLLNNALDASEAQSGVVSIGSKYDAEAHRVEIRVSDSGVGMDKQHVKQLYHPFVSTKGHRGTGLGLVVTKKVIDEHGGTIEVDSTPKQGTTFTLKLPTETGELSTSAETHGA